MNNNANFSKISQILENQNSLAICLPEKPTVDATAAALGLYLALTKLGKDVSVVCAAQVPQEVSLLGIDKIQTKLGSGGDTLVVSFPYSEGAIDKVSYNIEGDRFNLLIQPRAGFSKLNPDQVNYMYSGGNVGALFVIDSPTLQSLGTLYSSDENQFKGKDVINIDRHLTNANYGTLNIVERQAASTSEIVLSILRALNVEIDRDIATNLYSGIVAATNNFTAYSVNANTFESCAYLLKLGAVKKVPRKPLTPNKFPMGGQRPPTFTPRVNSSNMPMDMNSYGNDEDQVNTPEEVENKESKAAEGSANDWLKPKIFKGSGISNI